jgi:hypothetical protein
MAGEPVTPRALIVTGFVAILVLAIVTEVCARRPGSRWAPLGVTLAGALRTRGGRVVILGAWLWLGWHFLAR